MSLGDEMRAWIEGLFGRPVLGFMLTRISPV
jgi:hypothetical protein